MLIVLATARKAQLALLLLLCSGWNVGVVDSWVRSCLTIQEVASVNDDLMLVGSALSTLGLPIQATNSRFLDHLEACAMRECTTSPMQSR